MTVSIAHLGPAGTNTEAAALTCMDWVAQQSGRAATLRPYASIVQSLKAVAQREADFAVVPMENSIEGSVTMTLDALWQLDTLRIQRAIVMPIFHALMSRAERWEDIRVVYSHPQGLAQCQGWLDQFLPHAQRIPTNSTTEALQHLDDDRTIGAISPPRAAQLHNLPILASPINDYPGNCTRFLIVSLAPSPGGSHTSLAFSVSANQPGMLVKPLQALAERNINLSRIESRPTKRSLGEYLFFLDLEADTRTERMQSALADLVQSTETLKIFGSYDVLSIQSDDPLATSPEA